MFIWHEEKPLLLTDGQAVTFAYFAQLIGVVGSGFLSQPISAFFGVPSQAVWLSQVITILTVCLSPVVTQAADFWGRKWFLVGGLAIACVGAIISSRAQSYGAVLAGFTIIGVSFGDQAILHAVASEVMPRKHRPIAQAAINFSAGSGVITGLSMGGALLRDGNIENFRIYLYVVAGLFATATLGIFFAYNPPRRDLEVSLTFSEKIRKLDWIGYALLIPGFVLFCVGLAWYRSPYNFSNVRVVGIFVIGLVLSICLVIYEWKFHKTGIFHHDLFRHRNYALALLLVFSEGLAFFAANSYLVYEVVVVTGDDILIAAMHFALVSIVANVSSVLAGYWSWKWKVIRIPVFTGFVCFLLFFVMLAVTKTTFPASVFWGYPVLAGWGMGILLPTVIVAAQLSTPPALISTASGLLIAVRSLGGGVGIAVNNAIFSNALAEEVPSKVASATLPLGLEESSLPSLIAALASNNQTALQLTPSVNADIVAAAGLAYKEALFIGFRDVWIAASCFAVVAVIGKRNRYGVLEEITDCLSFAFLGRQQGRIL